MTRYKTKMKNTYEEKSNELDIKVSENDLDLETTVAIWHSIMGMCLKCHANTFKKFKRSIFLWRYELLYER